MGVLKPTAISWLSILLLSISVKVISQQDNVQEAFLQCLLDNSHPSHPISSAIFTPQNSSYSSVLQSYIRNRRFNETTTPKPFLILTALHQSHIQAAVVCAKKHDLQMKIRSGGHDYEGLSYVSTVPFFVLDILILDVVNSSSSTGGKTVRASFLSLFLGDSKTLLSIMNESFPELGLSQSDCIETSWIQSVLNWTNFPVDTSAKVLLNRTPQTLTFLKRKSDYVKEPIPKDGLEWLWKRMIELGTPTLIFNPYGGRMAEISASETPFPHRAGNLWKIQYVTNWNEAGAEAADHYINLTRKLHGYMTGFVSKNPREAFLNYRDIDLGVNHNGKASYWEGRVYGIKYFKSNFNRLVQIKTKVDPGNFFRYEQGIPTLPH
ncbi:hypothetical protein SLEP1_g16154 [Rubroshorea leprosula]|uniref:Berberine/berberine-like domain-containing protein n=1 Tax=Rubroshorea leprosula TaxID=152421 RepID=A0AAV5IQ03_9ROSI|nr:hypothetical protein SLEP1_g16154 [Rubroshorea leprosula]